MKSAAKEMQLTSVDDLFSTEQTRAEDAKEKITEIPLSELHPFPNHPFKVRDDEAMANTVESVKTYGILAPIIVRNREEGGYEIVSGHRRVHAAELAGKNTVPAIIRDLDRDAAVIVMVDSNLQREEILPSERAAAYKMKMEAIKHQGLRRDLTSSQVETKFQRADEIVAESVGESRPQVQRYIRLTHLEPELQQMVDEKKIGLTPAVEISYLKPNEQKLLLDTIESEQATPSLAQAQKMKKMSQEQTLNEDTMLSLMMQPKKPVTMDFVIPQERLRKYFPKNYTLEQMEGVIFKLLDRWQHRHDRDQCR